MNPNRIDSEEEVPFPEYWVKVWDNAHGDFNELVPLNRVEVSQFQKLVDQTYSNVYTKDRKKHNPTSPNVPQGYRVKKVLRNENSSNWREYGCRRAELLTRMQEEEENKKQAHTPRARPIASTSGPPPSVFTLQHVGGPSQVRHSAGADAQ